MMLSVNASVQQLAEEMDAKVFKLGPTQPAHAHAQQTNRNQPKDAELRSGTKNPAHANALNPQNVVQEIKFTAKKLAIVPVHQFNPAQVEKHGIQHPAHV